MRPCRAARAIFGRRIGRARASWRSACATRSWVHRDAVVAPEYPRLSASAGAGGGRTLRSGGRRRDRRSGDGDFQALASAANKPSRSRARAWRSRRLYGRGRHRVAIVVAEMAAEVVHHVRNLLVAHHAAQRRHVPLAADHDPQHGIGGGQLPVRGEGRIGAGAGGALGVGLVAGGADVGVDRRAALFGEFLPGAEEGLGAGCCAATGVTRRAAANGARARCSCGCRRRPAPLPLAWEVGEGGRAMRISGSGSAPAWVMLADETAPNRR